MRCPDCQHTQTYRTGTRCGRCNYQFIFRKKTDNISDYALRQLIKRLSDGGQHSFTATQLTLDLCRYWRRQDFRGGLLASILGPGFLAAFLGFMFSWKLAMIAFLVLLLPALWLSYRSRFNLRYPEAHKIVQRYHQAHPIAALADGCAFLQSNTPGPSQDLHYAPERILVVERDDLVDMLVRNRFHTTHKTAVISRTGYPKIVSEACRNFLRRHPTLPVQLLHDASLTGFNLKAQLTADRQWPLAGTALTDLGLSQETVKNTVRLPWLPASVRSKGLLSTDSTKMLSKGYRVPIDCMGPKPLLNLLGAAVIGGLLMLPTPSTSGDAAGEIEIGDDFG